jgi:CRP/FNR family transcriptional regulator
METGSHSLPGRSPFIGAPARALPPVALKPAAGFFPAQKTLFKVGEPAGDLFEIESGAVMVLRQFADGRRQILDIAGPGRVIGLASGALHDCSAIALRPTRARRIGEGASRAAAWPNANVVKAMFDEIHRLRDLATALGRKTAMERIAGFLLAMAKGAETGGIALVLPVSRQEIADHLGLAIETVCRNFKILERRGLIAIDGFFGVTILEARKIARIAAGDQAGAQALQA